jgi:tRNA dimethylallyltransferase
MATGRPAGWPAIALAGPTASGKTALALELADRLRPQVALEIVSVDSALVYRGLDIATAKPNAAERAAVPHHLIDILDPEEAYSAARFVADARRLIAEIQGRGALPLLVGGTMLYIKALRDGLDAMPAADPALRRQIEVEAAERGWPALHAELATVDPQTAARLAPADAQRIQRALEVWRGTGRPLSQWQTRAAMGPRRGDAPALIALEPRSRAWLHERINERSATMLRDGLVEEVRRLRARPGMQATLPAARCVGVRQVWQTLETGAAGAGEAVPDTPVAALHGAVAAATRQLAKRQLTWLRSMSDRVVLTADDGDPLQVLQSTLMRLVDDAS